MRTPKKASTKKAKSAHRKKAAAPRTTKSQTASSKPNTTRAIHEGAVFSPFSGQAADSENGPNEDDPTLLLTYYGDSATYGYVSERILKGREVEEVESLKPSALCGESRIEGMCVLEIDSGWNGVNTYAFAPAQATLSKGS
jgi:hypothetical protein